MCHEWIVLSVKQFTGMWRSGPYRWCCIYSPEWVHCVSICFSPQLLATQRFLHERPLCVGVHSNWGMMAISVDGILVFKEKAKAQISHIQSLCLCPKATLTKINTTKVIAIPIIANFVLSFFYCACLVSRKYPHFFCKNMPLERVHSCTLYTYLLILF